MALPQDARRFMELRAKWRKQQGMPEDNPPELQQAIDVEERHREYWQAFRDLSASRQVGMEASPILCSEVEAWCRLHRVRRWRWRSFWRVVHGLDVVWQGCVRKLQGGPNK